MANNRISLDALNEQLFDVIERLKSNNDPNASDNEKIDVDTASTIADLGKVIVDGYKVKQQSLNLLLKSQNPKAVLTGILDSGIVTEKQCLQALNVTKEE